MEREIARQNKEISDYKYALDESSIVAITNQKGIIIHANDNFCKISKYSRAELIGQDHRIINSGHHPKEFICDLWVTIANGKIWKGELKNKAKDGTIYWVDTTIVPFLNEEGKPFQYLAIRSDITNRKKAEEELKQYQHFFNNNNDLCGIANTKGYFDGINTTFCKVLGYTEKEFCSTPFIELIHPDDVASTILEYEKLKSGATVINFINRYRKKDGSYLWLDWNATPNSQTGKLYCVARDITVRKKAEEALRKSLKETSDYKYALDESSIVAITDQKGIIKYVNDNFCKISKYNREDLIGQDHRIINSGHHPKEFIRDLWVTIANGKTWIGELKNKAKDGTIYWVDTTIVPFLNEEGKPFQYLAIRADITARKKTEEELHNSNKALEAFSYSVAHDLRAPLRSVHGYAEILSQDYAKILDEEAKRIIGNIKQNASKMGKLIDDLLSFSRLGRKEIHLSKINMGKLTKEALIEINKSISHKADIRIDNLHEALGDYSLLYQVMMNLISNAIKYSSKKENPIIQIFSEVKNGEIIYSVKDNGAGFDMKYSDKLFGVFQRLHMEHEFEGTGVGLATVNSIITKHGGKIWAEGKVDTGATFYFTLLEN